MLDSHHCFFFEKAWDHSILSFFGTRGHDEDNKIKTNLKQWKKLKKKYHKYSQHATSSNLSHILMTRSHPLDHHHQLNNPNHPSILSPKKKKKKTLVVYPF